MESTIDTKLSEEVPEINDKINELSLNIRDCIINNMKSTFEKFDISDSITIGLNALSRSLLMAIRALPVGNKEKLDALCNIHEVMMKNFINGLEEENDTKH